MHKKFEINQTKIKGQSGRKVVTHNSNSDLPLDHNTKWGYDTMFKNKFKELSGFWERSKR